MTVKVKVDDAAIRGRFDEAGKRRALATLMPNVRSDTEKFVPYRSGYLSDTSLDASRFEQGVIAWRAPYARRVYYMPGSANWTRTRHPMAGPQWMERSKAANGERWRKLLVAAYGGRK